MTAYTGRSLLIGRIRCRIALWILEKRLPESITCVGKGRKQGGKQGQKEKPAPVRREKAPKREKATKRVKPVKIEGKREAPLKKQKAAPKRLMK